MENQINNFIFLEKQYRNIRKYINKLENYFGNTLDKYTKTIYKTSGGLFDYIMARKNGWIKNQKKS